MYLRRGGALLSHKDRYPWASRCHDTLFGVLTPQLTPPVRFRVTWHTQALSSVLSPMRSDLSLQKAPEALQTPEGGWISIARSSNLSIVLRDEVRDASMVAIKVTQGFRK